jgi:hypothetical protein
MINGKASLESFTLPANLKLALLWATLMFLYVYNDYFSLYVPGTIAGMAAGSLGPLGKATGFVMVGVSLMLAVPALMIFCSAVLPAVLSRWLNIILGLVYTAIEVLSLFRAELFYQIVVCLEIVLTILVIFYAVRWPSKI